MSRMPGRVVDLSHPGIVIPDPIACDTNVVVAYVRHAFPGEDAEHVARATALFGQIIARNQSCILTPTVYSEVLHLFVKKTSERLLNGKAAQFSAQFGVRINSWSDLLKANPAPLRALNQHLPLLRQALLANNMVIVGQEDLDFASNPPALPYGEELIARMLRYGMDTNDIVITMEASSLGIDAIVSMDRDMQRASLDFDVYTWL